MYYEIKKSLGKYVAVKVSDISNGDFIIELKNTQQGSTRVFSFNGKLYHNGELSDFSRNGWGFSLQFSGVYKLPKLGYNPDSNTKFKMDCLTPQEEQISLYYNIQYDIWDDQFAVFIYTQMMMISEVCKTEEDCKALIDLETDTWYLNGWDDVVKAIGKINIIRKLIDPLDDSDIKKMIERKLSDRFEKVKEQFYKLSLNKL